MQQQWCALVILLLLAGEGVLAFVGRAISRNSITDVLHRPTQLFMSTIDPLDEIRQKMATDPNYNPMQDPQAQAALEAMIPSEMKELPNALERLRIAMKDATTGASAVSDLNKVASEYKGPKTDLISSPQSEWMKGGMPNDNPAFSDSRKKELLGKVKTAFPEIQTK
jgi:hypothetical protein